MTTESLFSVPSELVMEWKYAADQRDDYWSYEYVACKAAEWAANVELAACSAWVRSTVSTNHAKGLQVARRPAPDFVSTSKERSIALLDRIQSNTQCWELEELNVIRQALEEIK
jgi:hypothetical protein